MTSRNDSLVEAGSFVYVAARSDARRVGLIQRFCPPVLRHAGRELAGLAEGQRWFYVGMVDDE